MRLLCSYSLRRRHHRLDDPGTFSSAPSVFRLIAEEQAPFPALEYDAPYHKEWRNLFRELVNPRTAKVLEPQVRADVDARIDRFIGQGEADLIADVALYIPAQTICPGRRYRRYGTRRPDQDRRHGRHRRQMRVSLEQPLPGFRTSS